MSIDAEKLARFAPRLEKERNIWFCSVRRDGRPHLIPIWYVWHDGRVWICTPAGTQKHVNILANPAVSVALESGDSPCILEGTAEARPDQAAIDALRPLFKSKFDWDFVTDKDADYILIAFTPQKILGW